MKILFAASECAPLVKVGGLADVVGGLPKALKKLGVDVAIVLPKYESIKDITVINVISPYAIKTINPNRIITIIVNYDGKQENVKILKTTLPQTSIPVYLLENPKYLSTGSVYSAKSAEGSPLDIDRFSFFSKAVVEFIKLNTPVIASPEGAWQSLANASLNKSRDPSISDAKRLSLGMTERGFDIIHCHDWHTAWIPLLLKTNQNQPKTLLTIHNMGKPYQGRTGVEVIEKLGISPSVIASPEGAWQSDNQNEVNILLQGIANADLINTVSPTYAQEIQTQEYGEGLNDILGQYQDKLSGILNGIDYEVWNPETDKNLTTNYGLSSRATEHSEEVEGSSAKRVSLDSSTPPASDGAGSVGMTVAGWQEGKKRNKTKLLETIDLPQGENIPTFGMVTRIAEQKGFDILIPALEQLFSRHSGEPLGYARDKLRDSRIDSGQARMTSSDNVRVVILGVGDPDLEFRISNLEFKYKDKLKFITRFDEVLAHLIYSGADFFLVPSRFEPSGLIQLIAMRYGTLPIVRKTGGLADSVQDRETGFVFEEYTSEALLEKIEVAILAYRHSGEPLGFTRGKLRDSRIDSGQARMTQFKEMVISALQKDFSWDKSAKEYLKLYEKLLK